MSDNNNSNNNNNDNNDEPLPSCKFMEVKKEVPEWLAHRNKVLFSATHKKAAAPSDESELEDSLEEIVVPTKGEEDYDDEAARLFHNAGYSKESTSELLKDSNETSEDSFSDDSGVLPSSSGSSGWSTPLEADLSSHGLEEPPDSPLPEPPQEYYEQELAGTIVEENPARDNLASDGRQSPDYTEESYRTEETFETVTVEEEMVEDTKSNHHSNEELAPESGNERSMHSAGSFWGNPVRYHGDPFREKDDPREPTGNQPKWNYHKPNTEEEDESPDPPASMDGSPHRTSNYYHSSALDESGTEQNSWMPPSDRQQEDKPASDEEDAANEGILSVFTTTIAETMKKLTRGGDAPPETSNHSSTSARIDFAGQTSYSTADTIRKYYDKGRNRNANEDMRRLYMPTRVPDIANPDTDEEELFDWVPRKYKKDGPVVDENGAAATSSDMDDPYSADDENYVSGFTSDDEHYKSTNDRIYTSDEEDDIESNHGDGYLSYEERASYDGIETVYSESKNARLSPNGTSETNDTTAMEPQDTEVKRKLFPCHCVHVGICLIVFLVPLVVFGIKYYPYWTSWLYNLFN